MLIFFQIYAKKLPVELSAVQQSLPRGVSPETLLAQVRNTVPFLFDEGFTPAEDQPHLKLLRKGAATSYTHFEYFRLCLAAHHATVASFVPTDVDHQIRFKLWSPQAPLETLRAMAELVLESRGWSYAGFSTRYVEFSDGLLGGHLGEWFSTAAAAYGALRRRDPDLAARVGQAILAEVRRHARAFEEFRSRKDGLGLLKCATLIAHNLGDLDRVIEEWKIPADDPIAETVFKAGHEAKPGLAPLVQAGALNKAMMADENHRHFALRTPKCLRASRELLLPIGPFFDDWGRRVARILAPEDVAEVVQALIAGWEKLAKPVGYARALAGIEDKFPGGLNALGAHLPARAFRTLKSGALRTLIATPQNRFEDQWAKRAVALTQQQPSSGARAASSLPGSA